MASSIGLTSMFNRAASFGDQWISWVGAAAEVLAAYVHKHVRYYLPVVGATLHSAKPSRPLCEYKTAEKIYRINDDGRVLKRSLRENEYHILSNGDPFVPVLVVERLKNEVACMRYLKAHTDIPIPKILDMYEKNGSYYLWMEFIDGVEMCELTNEEQSRVLPQVRSIVATLQGLRSRFAGGPTGILSPPSMVYFYHLAEWQQQTSVKEEFVFCHGDLSQNNILVNPKTLQIVAIIDWEYGGFFPRDHEIPFYESSGTSGEQVKGNKLNPVVDKIIEFWRQSRTPAG